MTTPRDHTPKTSAPKRRTGQRKGATAKAPSDVEIAERRERVAFLLASHVPQREIARRLDVSLSTIVRDVVAIKGEWRERAVANATDHLAEELATLEETERRLWQEQLAARPIDLNAVKVLLSLHDRRARLLGLDRPNRIEVTGLDGGPIMIEDNDAALLADIERLGERLAAMPTRELAP